MHMNAVRQWRREDCKEDLRNLWQYFGLGDVQDLVDAFLDNELDEQIQDSHTVERRVLLANTQPTKVTSFGNRKWIRNATPATVTAALQHHPVGRQHQVSRLREENLHGVAEAAAGGDSGQNQGPS